MPPEKLFREYFYRSSFSDTMLQHAAEITSQLIRSSSLGPGSLVVEIASNDGYLLQYYKQAGVPVLGIEPAINIARIAEQELGIPTICDFFSEELAEQLRAQGRLAEVIHANNVLAHVANLNGFMRGISRLLKDEGVLVVEVPYVKEMIDGCEFDTIYHEHLSYFSLTAMHRLFCRHGLSIHQVERLPIHGGTLRVYASHAKPAAGNDSMRASHTSVVQLLDEEISWGVNKLDFYVGFGENVERRRGELLELLRDLKARNKKIAAYGASAKGSTLLNYVGIGKETIDYVVDRSTIKRGRSRRPATIRPEILR